MSILGRKVSTRAVVTAVGVMLVLALLPVMTSEPAREITVVARNMAFYLDGDFSTPNPVIRVAAGERVRIVLRNEERGMTHDLAVPAAAAATTLLRWHEQGQVTFTVPDRPGTYEYVCSPHALMMRGEMVVE